MIGPERATIAVVGAAGSLGRLVVSGLQDHLRVLAIDRRRVAGVRRMDARNVRRLAAAFDGVTTVVDLAGDPRADAPWDLVLGTNMATTHAVLEAARQAGVARVVQASSNQVTMGYEGAEPWASVVAGRYGDLDPGELPKIDVSMPVRPTNDYALGKVFGEAACRYYAEVHGLSTVAIRIGTVLPGDEPRTARHFATLLSHADLISLVGAACSADLPGRHAVVYGVSANTWRIWDLSSAERALGWAPSDDAERHRRA